MSHREVPAYQKALYLFSLLGVGFASTFGLSAAFTPAPPVGTAVHASSPPVDIKNPEEVNWGDYKTEEDKPSRDPAATLILSHTIPSDEQNPFEVCNAKPAGQYKPNDTNQAQIALTRVRNNLRAIGRVQMESMQGMLGCLSD